VVTNRSGEPVDLLRWHWLKAGTIEFVHDVTKNELAARVPPSSRIGDLVPELFCPPHLPLARLELIARDVQIPVSDGR